MEDLNTYYISFERVEYEDIESMLDSINSSMMDFDFLEPEELPDDVYGMFDDMLDGDLDLLDESDIAVYHFYDNVSISVIKPVYVVTDNEGFYILGEDDLVHEKIPGIDFMTGSVD